MPEISASKKMLLKFGELDIIMLNGRNKKELFGKWKLWKV